MSKPKNKLTVRCFFCGKIGDMTRDDGSVFSASVTRVGDKFGCICINCLQRLYRINQQFMDQTVDTPPHVGSIKNRVLAPHQAELVVKKKSNPLDDVFPSFGTWQCLDNSLESYIKLIESRVFGQSEAVRRVALALYNNQFCNMLEYLGIDDVPERDMVLLIGSTGVGKTFLAKTAAEAMGIPYALIKAETLTSTGWVGGNVESILEHLYYAADRDLERAQTGIIIIDEIDKKAKNLSEKGRDINGLAVQQELLKILEPSKVSIFHDSMTFDTSRLTLILEGAFVGLYEIIRERIHPTHIGFGNNELDSENILDLVEPEDIIKYGFIDEFVGRVPNPVVMKKLSFDTILDIIYAKLEKQRTIFDSKQFRLQIDPAVLTEITYRVLSHKTGARDVKKELDALLYEAKYHLYNVPSNGECIIDAHGNTSFLYADKKNGKPRVDEYPGPAYLQDDE